MQDFRCNHKLVAMVCYHLSTKGQSALDYGGGGSLWEKNS